MKIAFVSNYLKGYHSHSGGAEKAILQTAELARGKGHEAFFVTLPFDSVEPRPNTDIPVYSALVIESLMPLFKKYIEILKWYLFQFDPVSYFSLLAIFGRERPDVVHLGNFQFISFSAVAAAKTLNIPVILSVYDYWYFCPSTSLFDHQNRICRKFHGPRCARCLPDEFRPVQSALLHFRKMCFSAFFAGIDKFIALSRSSADILRAYGIGGEKIETIRLPFSAASAAGSKKTVNSGYILFTGWLQTRKGLHMLLEAMPLVWKRRPEVKLRIVAQKVKWEKEYENLIASKLKGLPSDKFTFELGEKSKAEMENTLLGAGIVVVPEQWENMSPLVVIEAMTHSKPIVASGIGGIPELIEHEKTGLCSKTDDASDLASNILRFLDDKNFAEECGQRAFEKAAAMFEPSLIADQLDKEYQKWTKQ